MKTIHINHKWFDTAADDATLLAVLKYILRDETPDDETLFDRVAPTLDRIDTDRRTREAARERRAARAREAKAAREAAAQNHTTLEATTYKDSTAPNTHPAATPEAAAPDTVPLTPDYCARIFQSFPTQIRTDLAIREVNRIEAEIYPIFKKFIADFSPVCHYSPEVNWPRLRQLFPTTWHTLTPHLHTHLLASNINRRHSTPTEFFNLLRRTLNS